MAVLETRQGRWVKVAWVVVCAPDLLGSDFPSGETGHELVAARIAVLVDQGQLMARGEIAQWRHSEIKPA